MLLGLSIKLYLKKGRLNHYDKKWLLQINRFVKIFSYINYSSTAVVWIKRNIEWNKVAHRVAHAAQFIVKLFPVKSGLVPEVAIQHRPSTEFLQNVPKIILACYVKLRWNNNRIDNTSNRPLWIHFYLCSCMSYRSSAAAWTLLDSFRHFHCLFPASRRPGLQ